MRDRLIVYAIAASIGVHLVLLAVVGRTSAAKPIAIEQLKAVQVDLVKTPDQPVVNQDKPAAPRPEPPKVNEPHVPPVSKMVTDRTPPKPKPQPAPVRHSTMQPVRPSTRQPVRRPTHTTPVPYRGPVRQGSINSTELPGNPGGELRVGTSDNGQDMGQVNQGKTPVGWVPSNNGGTGAGSGTGPGIGKREPDPKAQDGPGQCTAPAPKLVSVSVCSESGLLPGKYCDKKETRSYREDSSPGRFCDRCKAAAPVHVNRLADRSEPELIKDTEVKLPDIDDPGNFTVRVRYTVTKDGSVSNVEVTESSGIPAIDRAVVRAAEKLRYKPAVQNGEPRSVTIRRKYRISL